MATLIQRFSESFANEPPKEAGALLNLMQIACSDEAYRALVAAHLSKSQHFEQRRGLLDTGWFSLMDLFNLLIGSSLPNGVNARTVSELLKRLTEWSVVIDNDLEMAGQFARYQWNKGAIGLFSTLRILDNILLGRQHVIKKYTPSIPAIIVRKNGAERVGTGFLTHNHFGGKHFVGEGHILTAKHNVDPAEDIEFLRLDGASAALFELHSRNWKCHPTLDIAALPVRAVPDLAPLYPLGDSAVLTRTITLGYPQISTADGPYLLAHNGEINAQLTSYLDKASYLAISNSVSPGNSGGPVLDDSGLCVGMVVRALEAEYEGGGTNKTNVAIPAEELQQFVRSLDAVQTK